MIRYSNTRPSSSGVVDGGRDNLHETVVDGDVGDMMLICCLFGFVSTIFVLFG
ncbi:hypothetical protein B0H12DRAFT_1162714, partial [Mycena haematopus]